MSLLHLAGTNLDHLLQQYGLWAVVLLVFLESTGVPSPGETMLITAGAYAGATHNLSPFAVIGAAAAAAMLGDNMGYWIGREGGWRLVRRYGHALHVDDGTLKIGILLFRRHGGKVVFAGRFVPVLRTYGALLAGVNRFPWRRFLFWNATSALAWAGVWGTLAYSFGRALEGVRSGVSLGALGLAVVLTVAAGVVFARRRGELRAQAERDLPGDLDAAA